MVRVTGLEPAAWWSQRIRGLFYNIFIAVFALFDMLFRTLHPQSFRVVHPQLWQNMWSKTLPGLGR